jgi:hypothetical protein
MGEQRTLNGFMHARGELSYPMVRPGCNEENGSSNTCKSAFRLKESATAAWDGNQACYESSHGSDPFAVDGDCCSTIYGLETELEGDADDGECYEQENSLEESEECLYGGQRRRGGGEGGRFRASWRCGGGGGGGLLLFLFLARHFGRRWSVREQTNVGSFELRAVCLDKDANPKSQFSLIMANLKSGFLEIRIVVLQQSLDPCQELF